MDMPSLEKWLEEAKSDNHAEKIGMYLAHNGVVRQTAKAEVRGGLSGLPPVKGMLFSYNSQKAEAVAEQCRRMDGIYHVRYWLNEGRLQVGDSLMLVLIGGDTRPNVMKALDTMVGRLKNECVTETEL